MRIIIAFTLSTWIVMNIYSQQKPEDREPVAAGRFYPAGREILNRDLSVLFGLSVKPEEKMDVRAIISPHAGYVFSGKTAASAFSVIPKERKYRNIFLIGSSHVMAFDGASVYTSGDYLTPIGKIEVNTEIAGRLKSDNHVFRFPSTSHIQEHSLEVQIPFIQYYFDEPPAIVPIIIGTSNKKTVREIAEALKPWFNDENLFVISSDFSHYPSYKDAYEIDGMTADAIVSKNSELFLTTLSRNSARNIEGLATSMCGWTSGLLIMYLAADDPDLEFRKIHYCNSGDSNYGNKNEVVGYHAIALVRKNNETGKRQAATGKNPYEVSFSAMESEKLLSLARNSISTMLKENKRVVVDPGNLPEIFKRKMGAFVTLKIDGKLRGCIGRFTSEDPLYEVVNQMAVESAFNDARFDPLATEELARLEIEISVLGPLRRIENISEIVPGKHGIYIKKDFRSGTMLPQVAVENNWTVEEFLGYTSREKAGLGWNGWKEAEIFVYEAVVLKENK